MGGQRCARPGCRAWAMRGRSYCRMHQRQDQVEQEVSIDGAGECEEEAEVPAAELESRIPIPLDLVTARVEALLAESRDVESDEITLREEISALRLVLARVLAEESNLNRQAVSVPRIVNTVIRAAQAQRLLAGAKAEAITEAVTQVLLELGLGSDDDR